LSSQITHGSPIAIDSCRYSAYVVVHLLLGYDKNIIFSNQFIDDVHTFFNDSPLHKTLEPIVNGEFMTKSEDEIYSTGYSIDSLEASMWSFYHTNSFEEAILKAVNLGDDTDTVGAITGQISGAYYSYDSIPEKWVKGLSQYELIKSVTHKLINHKK
jgi:ADP-ribosyl-[dinitrogen reductase] hydrolase